MLFDVHECGARDLSLNLDWSTKVENNRTLAWIFHSRCVNGRLKHRADAYGKNL